MGADLRATAGEIVANDRGILAADESTGTIKKRFDAIDVESTEENRRAYRDMLFTTPGLGEFISGVILYDETIRQSSADGAVSEAARGQRDDPRHQGRHRAEAARPLAERDRHGGPRRAARAPAGTCNRARSPSGAP